jgi:hypothetical protein
VLTLLACLRLELRKVLAVGRDTVGNLLKKGLK